MKIASLFLLLTLAVASPAFANCDFVRGTTNCNTDSRGNTYITERNMGGGYNTYKNGQMDSQTSQTFSRDYRTDYPDGSSSYSNKSPDSSRNHESKSNERFR